MSRELSPWPRGSHVTPPSLLRKSASISTPAQMVLGSVGSIMTVVTRVCMMRGHSRMIFTAGSLHVLPPSSVRNKRDGHVPTTIKFGSLAEMAIDHTCSPLIGDSMRDQLLA